MTGNETETLRYRILIDIATPELSARAGDVVELTHDQAHRVLTADPAALIREPGTRTAVTGTHQWAGSNTR